MSEDPSVLTASYERKLPIGCPYFDVIKANLVNAKGEPFELYMTPDEAMLLANNLIGASLECLFEDKSFHKKYINSRKVYMEAKAKFAMAKQKET